MPGTPLHPAIVHLPLGIALIQPLVAGALALAVWRGLLPARAFALALGLQVLLVGGGLVALRTGEADEEVVERIVPEPAIEAHEEAAEVFVAVAAGAVALMAGGALAGAGALGTALRFGSAAASCAVLGLAIWTGMKGGEVAYAHGGAAAFATAPGAAAAAPGAPPARDARRHGDED